MKYIPKDKLNNKIRTSEEISFTIKFLFADYVEHLEHHLRQILIY